MDDKTLFYLTTEKNKKESGVWNKVIDQCEALYILGFRVFLICWSEEGFLFINVETNKQIVLEDRMVKNLNYNKIKKKYNKYNWFYKFLVEKIKIYRPNILYFRLFLFMPSFFNILKIKNNNNNNITTFLEIPTYPYRDELLKNKRYLNYLWDLIIFPILKKKMDFIVVITDCIITTINKKKIVYISNGINSNRYRTKKTNFNEGTINLIGVAKYSFWHGYDRLIVGLHEYYKNGGTRNILVRFVGSNMQDLNYLVQQYNLSDHIVFYEAMYGEALDELYDKSDIAIGSLGMFRKGFSCTSELKVREYFARGIPYIIGCEDIEIPSNYPFQLIFENNNNPIDIFKIIELYNTLSNNDCSSEMRKFASEKLSWNSKMSFVLEKIKCCKG